MRGLDKEELRIVFEVTHRLQQEIAGRRVVRIEDGDEFAGRMFHAVVEIAGLGVLVAVAREVVDIEIVAELLQLDMAGGSRLGFEQLAGIALLQGAAVVEQPDMQLLGRIIHGLGGGQRVSNRPASSL